MNLKVKYRILIDQLNDLTYCARALRFRVYQNALPSYRGAAFRLTFSALRKQDEFLLIAANLDTDRSHKTEISFNSMVTFHKLIAEVAVCHIVILLYGLSFQLPELLNPDSRVL
jgi:hypothetical protein